MTALTYGAALAAHNVTIPEHLVADAEVPVLTGVQAQGDLLIRPICSQHKGVPVPDAGVQVIHGEATGNTHWLNRGPDSPGVTWAQPMPGADPVVLGVLTVPAGQSAYLIHTDEHGANGVGPGVYEIRRQREQADEIRYVSD